jgi:hypothetical protein
MKEDEIGRACGTYGEEQKSIDIFVNCSWVDPVAVVHYTFTHKQYTE